jgi:hypothetical protein
MRCTVTSTNTSTRLLRTQYRMCWAEGKSAVIVLTDHDSRRADRKGEFRVFSECRVSDSPYSIGLRAYLSRCWSHIALHAVKLVSHLFSGSNKIWRHSLYVMWSYLLCDSTVTHELGYTGLLVQSWSPCTGQGVTPLVDTFRPQPPTCLQKSPQFLSHALYDFLI